MKVEEFELTIKPNETVEIEVTVNNEIEFEI
jgi:uncharacterized cupredoxin-like copper-binding protein